MHPILSPFQNSKSRVQNRLQNFPRASRFRSSEDELRIGFWGAVNEAQI